MATATRDEEEEEQRKGVGRSRPASPMPTTERDERYKVGLGMSAIECKEETPRCKITHRKNREDRDMADPTGTGNESVRMEVKVESLSVALHKHLIRNNACFRPAHRAIPKNSRLQPRKYQRQQCLRHESYPTLLSSPSSVGAVSLVK
jgi:hypothetical protein